MVVIKYVLGAALLVAGVVAYSHRDAVIGAYRWDAAVTRPVLTPFDAATVAEAGRIPVPPDQLGTVVRTDTGRNALPTMAPPTVTAPPVQGGTAAVAGAVLGPDGNPVPGATVRLERLVGDRTATLDVTTSSAGTFSVDRLLGGRYRVRAWRAPNLTQEGSEVTFLADGERRSVTLGLSAPSRLDLGATLSPAPLVVGQTAVLAVRALLDVVAADGRIDKVDRPGQTITAVGTGAFSGQTGQAVTDATGSATFSFRCAQAGSATVTVGNGAARQTVTAECVPISTTTIPQSSTTTTASTTGGR